MTILGEVNSIAQFARPGRFGHSGKPDDAWLTKQEKEHGADRTG
jgi:hypothetical protein